MLSAQDQVKVGDRVMAELDTKEGLFATSFFVSKLHRDGTITVTTEKGYRNGVERPCAPAHTFRAELSAFDYKA